MYQVLHKIILILYFIIYIFSLNLQAIEAKSVLGRHDTSLFLKAQMDNLQGRNDELRLALREIRHEANTTNLAHDKAMEKVGNIRN